jgi:hypothetical protein
MIERTGNTGKTMTLGLTTIKVNEINTMELNGVKMIISNNKGVSLYTLEGILAIGLTGFAWQFREGTAVVQGLKLVNDKPGHYMLVPVTNMPLEKYKGLLEEMGIKCAKYLRVRSGNKVEKV